MTRKDKRRRSAQVQIAVAASMLLAMIFLLVMSSRTGQREFQIAKQQLDAVEAVNIRLDGVVFMLLFELQMDFDQLAQQQREIRAAGWDLAGVLPKAKDRILPLIERKIEVLEEFKSDQAVFRNSRAIAGQLIAELWEHPSIGQETSEQLLFDVERALLDFVGRRDPMSGQQLRAVLEESAGSGAPVTALAEWDALVAHAETLIDYTNRLAAVMTSEVFYQLPVVLYEEGEQLADDLAMSVTEAGRYRALLFFAGLLLLVFSAMMAIRVRRYLQMIERHNDELEDRVRERTEELANVNAALRTEIAEREHVEGQLRISQKLEAIGQLASGIAHEINTPTQYVSDNVSFLSSIWQDLEPVLDDYEKEAPVGEVDEKRGRGVLERANVAFMREEVPAALQQAAEGLQQIESIVCAMRNFSHPGADDMRPADLNTAIESTATVARSQWRHVAELSLDLEPSLPPVSCNVSAVNQALLNLIVNAVHAIQSVKPKGGVGRIRIVSRRCGDHVRIDIEDDGPGVPAPIRHRIFDPFFTTKEIGKGTGQGLAISHRVIHQMHGGTLVHEAVPGGGARFVIRLPLERNRGQADAAAEGGLCAASA